MIDVTELIERVNGWLPGAGVSVSEAFTRSGEGDEDPGLLVLELEGGALDVLRKRYGGKDGRLLLNWLLPAVEENGYIVRDILQTGDSEDEKTWMFPMLFRMKQFDKKFLEKNSDVKPLNLCPDIEADGSGVRSAWLYDAELKWKRFARKAAADRDKEDGVAIRDIVMLEAGLNAAFTDSMARAVMKLEECKKDNPLAAIEARRQVRIDWPAESLGRLRIPHTSHENRLCPFETPESKRTGLNLYMAAGAEGVEGGRIKEGKALLSVAVGMVPYPTHTDGPRLMMGGKNMKQAEPGIDGREPPIVPGYYEGNVTDEIKALEDHLDEHKRLRPYLGLNAMTVIMPFRGYTYEDGLAVSESLAKRLKISRSHYVCSKQFKFVIRKEDIEEAGIRARDVAALKAYFEDRQARHVGERFVYGDPLPEPGIPMYQAQKTKTGKKGDVRLSPCDWKEVYAHHAPGTLDKVQIQPTLTVDIKSNHYVELLMKWEFTVERPLSIGDKLTGRNGNKGVVTRIVPDEEMPLIHFRKPDGTDDPERAELIISPSSIMGRKNLGQIWEMTHSLLLKKSGCVLPRTGDGYKFPTGEEAYREFVSDRLKDLKDIGADERGTFEIEIPGTPGRKRAFAGWQYFCRLYHHSWKKLQARGEDAPFEAATGQPMRCGARTGQRLGEMENWSLLSHGAKDVLLGMRGEQTGDFNRTRELLKAVLLSLGMNVREKRSGLEFVHGDDKAVEETLQKVLSEEAHRAFHVSYIQSEKKKKDEAAEPEKPRRTLREEFINALDTLIAPAGNAGEGGEEQKERSKFQNPIVKKAGDLLASGFFDETGGIHIDTALLDYYPELKTALQKFNRSVNNPERRISGMLEYRDGLIKRLSGKEGIPRRFLLGRRYNHSGRAVIVPDSTLTPHELRLPIAMLVELLDGYDGDYLKELPQELRNYSTVQGMVNDCPNRVEEAKVLAKLLDTHLREHPLWCFAVRQPSLHRHSVQSFMIRCWEEPVIGLPPFVTPGFNADFDGDTMAVFLPPYRWAKNLSDYAIENNPGLVGTGKHAFADGLDLALGWWNMSDKERWYKEIDETPPEKSERISEYLPRFIKAIAGRDFNERGRIVQELQAAICEASTCAATLTPLEFDAICKELASSNMPPRVHQDKEEERKVSQKTAETELKNVLKRHRDFGLNTMLDSGAKGGLKDVLQMTWAIGEVDKMKDYDEEDPGTEKIFIPGNFWEGLTEKELFLYSYPSRYTMAQKKLSVATAGYLTRQLAEGLYEVTVEDGDCGTDSGLSLKYETGQLTLDDETVPTLGSLEKDLTRILWGRVPLGMSQCLNMKDIEALAGHWKDGAPMSGDLAEHLSQHGDALIIRSPLTCHKRMEGHICPLCYGADLAMRPYDNPVPVKGGFAAGLTAAQAIGERGTQLAMKRFHDVAGGPETQAEDKKKDELRNAIREMRSLLVFGNVKGSILQTLFNRVLAREFESTEADGELQQAIIHFETALMHLEASKAGLGEIARESGGRFLSALSNERIGALLNGQTNFTDKLDTVKSALIWGGEK